MLRREAAVNLESLVASAAAAGEELAVASGYRSYEDQRASYARLVSVFGKDADRTSAPPGHSQHQLGTAVDFTNAAVGYEVMRKFGRTTAAAWLQEHAHEHGFALSYPPGRHARTGYHWEPWHYRYVGEENARRAMENPLGLQGLLLQEGVLPNC
jgi:D-alanyl-D-alanine carboxypeptidase